MSETKLPVGLNTNRRQQLNSVVFLCIKMSKLKTAIWLLLHKNRPKYLYLKEHLQKKINYLNVQQNES